MLRYFEKVDVAAVALRLTLAAIFISMGLAKLSANWGTDWQQVNPATFSAGLQSLIAWCEFLAGIGLLFGILTRVSALVLLCVMVGSIWYVSFHPEYMHPVVTATDGEVFSAAPTLWQYNYAVAGMCLALLILGGGEFSVDNVVWRSFFHHEPATPEGTVAVPQPVARPAPTTGFARFLHGFVPRRGTRNAAG